MSLLKFNPSNSALRRSTWYSSTACRGIVTLVVLLAFASSQATISAADSNGIAAVVNADPITEKALTESTLERYGNDVLENMINRHLILQQCQVQGIEITNADVRAEIQRTAEKFKLSMADYLKLLADERDITPAKYSREIVWPMLALRSLVADKIQITQEEYNRAYLSQYGNAVKCRMIMVADKSKADSLHQQAMADPSKFESLAKQFSEDETSASVGGLIPPIRRFTGDEDLENTVFALKENEVSKVMALGDQWIILQSVRQMQAAPPKPTDIPLIRAQIEDQIRNRKTQAAASELFARLQSEAKVIKVLGNPNLSKQYPGAAAVINGQQLTIAMVGAECLKNHGAEILEVEITRKLLQQALKKAGKTVTDADLSAEVSQAAMKYGFVNAQGQPDVGRWLESVTSDGVSQSVYVNDSVWLSVALRKLVEDRIEVTQADLTQGFESSYGPRVEILAVVLADQRTAQKVWEMARDNPTDQFFGSLAEQYSIEAVSRSNFGKVPPVRKHGGQPAIEREAFQMKPGDLSGIVATGEKYIVMRCQGYTEPVVSDFEDVKDELTADIRDKKIRQAMATTLDALHDSAEVDNFFELKKKQEARTAGAVRPVVNR